MDEQASFEPQAVLGRRRAGWNRLAIVVPALAFAVVAWAGLSGPRPATDQLAEAVATSTQASPSVLPAMPRPPVAYLAARDYPAQVIGLDVRRLDDLRPSRLGRDDEVAVAGWYVATAITNCPRLAAIYRAGSLPEVRGDADSWAFCERSGVLYASQPELGRGLATANPENTSRTAGGPAVPVALVIGVVVPPELEIIGTQATPVVVVGRFVESNEGCGSPAVCHRELVVDHVAWAPGMDGAVGQLPRLPADGVNALTGG